MFKDVPYFCHSHLMALLNVSATFPAGTPLPAPAFNVSMAPPPPMHMEKILSPNDLAVAQDMINTVSMHVHVHGCVYKCSKACACTWLHAHKHSLSACTCVLTCCIHVHLHATCRASSTGSSPLGAQTVVGEWGRFEFVPLGLKLCLIRSLACS
jgi:hypothetical protein